MESEKTTTTTIPAETNGDRAGGHAHRQSPEHGHPGHTPVLATAGTGRRIAVAAALVAVGLAAVYVFGLRVRHDDTAKLQAAARESASLPPAVQVVRVRRATPRTLLALPGEARALYETTIYARTNGYLSKWLVDMGDRVKQGQVLATIETPELDDQMAAAQAKVAQEQSGIELAQANANFAKLSYQRWESAAPEGAVSAQDRDQKKAELDTSVAKLSAAKAQLKLAQADVQRLQTLIGFKSVLAPFDGTITERHVDIGELVTAGSTSSTTPLFSIARSDQIRVFVDVPQGASPEIKLGMTAEATAAEHPGRKFAGKVDRTADSIDPVSRTLRVEVLVPNADLSLKPGMYLQVEFQTDRRDPPLEIPASALNMRPSGPEAAIIAADGTVRFQPITIARDMGDYIEVSSGLSDGQTVALNITSDVEEGERVTPREVQTPAAQPAPPVPKSTTAMRASSSSAGGVVTPTSGVDEAPRTAAPSAKRAG